MTKFLIAGLMAAAAVPALAQVAPVAPIAGVQPIRPVVPVRPMGDGVMTRAEVQAMVQAHFARRDANHDGFIAGDEMTMRAKHPGGAWQGENARMGMRHGDPKVAFDRLDGNHDGMISRDEFARGHQVRIERRVAVNRQPGAAGRPGMMRMHHRMGGGMGGMRLMAMADVNKDGRISIQEAQSTALQHFDMADANRDGRVTRDEMRAAHQRTMPRAG